MAFFDWLRDEIVDTQNYIETENEEKRERERKKRDIDDYNKCAREYVDEGREIYDDAYSDFLDYSYDIERKIRDHYEFKRKLIAELGSKINPVIDDFKKFNIDNLIVPPTINSASSVSEMTIYGTNYAMRGIVSNFTETLVDVSIIDLIFDRTRDLDEELRQARQNKSKSEKYRSKMRQAAERLNSARSHLVSVSTFVDDEYKMLNNLMSKLRPMTATLQKSISKSSFTSNEAMYLKGISKISENIVDLMSTRFLSDNLLVTNEYKFIYDKVKKIELGLADAPAITGNTSALVNLLRILDNTVEY